MIHLNEVIMNFGAQKHPKSVDEVRRPGAPSQRVPDSYVFPRVAKNYRQNDFIPHSQMS
jgi:hypothetical protein